MGRSGVAALWSLAFAALVVLTTLAALALGIPQADLPELVGLLAAVGLVGGAALVVLLRPVVLGRVVGIRGQLLAPVLAVSFLLLALVVAGARQMFISEHDRAVLLTMLLFAGALASGIGWLSAVPIAGRIERLRAATRDLAAGQPAPVLATGGSDELAGLAHDFDAMALALRQAADHERELEAARRNLIAAVSHDLRAPLAAMRVVVEALADGIVSDDEGRRRYLETAQREISHLGQLVDDLFELAQIDAGVLRLQLERASLSDLISDTLASYQPRAERQGVVLRGEVDGDVDPVLIDAARIQRVLHNLLENALRHTLAGGAIVLRSRREGDGVAVEVADDGEGIAPADLPHVFERSFRGDPARTRRSGDEAAGAGLGLTIARGLVEAHGGRISVESVLGQGTCLRFTLQRA